jgi:plastocyanin
MRGACVWFCVALLAVAVKSQYLTAPRLYTVEGVGREPVQSGYSAENQYFTPDRLTIFVGDSVRFFWVKGNHNVVQVHNASSTAAIRDTHHLIGFGTPIVEEGELLWTFTKPGEYHYICEPHITCCNMRGVIKVVPRPVGAELKAAPVAGDVALPAAVSPPSSTKSFLDDLVLGGESHATDVIAGLRAPVTSATFITGTGFVNGDAPEHMITHDVLEDGTGGRYRFNRVAFTLTLVSLGCCLMIVILCVARRNANLPAPGKARIVHHEQQQQQQQLGL